MKDIRPELLDELLLGYEKPPDLLGEDGIFRALKKRLLERALSAELSEHLGYAKGERSGRRGANNRNGHTAKTVLTDEGSVTLAVPRDRDGTFEPAIVPKGVTRLEGFDGQIISLYARGLSVREVQAHLRQMYQVEVSPDLISRVTDAVHEDVQAWRNRPLEAVYQAATAEAAEAALDAFEAGPWARRYPMIAPMWRRARAYLMPFFAIPPAIRKMIYTTNAVESLNRSLRKVIKTRGSFPSDEAALKLLYLAIQNAGLRWQPAIA
jgi:transposase-like protein